jgi:hypothetical protein
MTKTDSGLSTLRRAVQVRARQSNLGRWARDLGVGSETLFAFGQGTANLNDEIVQRITREIFGDNASYDASCDKLRRAPPPSTPVAAAYPPVAPSGRVAVNLGGQGMPPADHPPKPKTPSPGWA